MKLKVITPAQGPIMTLARAKEYLRVTHNLEDNSILQMLQASTMLCEKYCRVFFLPLVVKATLNIPRNPSGIEWEGIHLAGGEVLDIQNLQLVAKNSDISSLLVEGTNWWTRSEGQKTFLMLDPQTFSAIVREKQPDSLAITYKVGLASDGTLDQQRCEFAQNYPDIMEAICVTLNLFYDTRGVSNVSLTMQAKRLLDSHRVTEFAEI